MLKKWLKNKKTNENAWRVDVKDIQDFNLDSSNPNEINESVVLPPNELIDQFIHIRKEMIKEFEDIKKIITREVPK